MNKGDKKSKTKETGAVTTSIYGYYCGYDPSCNDLCCYDRGYDCCCW